MKEPVKIKHLELCITTAAVSSYEDIQIVNLIKRVTQVLNTTIDSLNNANKEIVELNRRINRHLHIPINNDIK